MNLLPQPRFYILYATQYVILCLVPAASSCFHNLFHHASTSKIDHNQPKSTIVDAFPRRTDSYVNPAARQCPRFVAWSPRRVDDSSRQLLVASSSSSRSSSSTRLVARLLIEGQYLAAGFSPRICQSSVTVVSNRLTPWLTDDK